MQKISKECRTSILLSKKKAPLKIFLLCSLALLAAGCIRFQPKPIIASKVLDDFEARRLDAPELRDFLLKKQGLTTWPPSVWNLHSLTLAAFFYHPDLDVARAQWGVARAGRITAGERPNPIVSVLVG